MLKKEIEFVDFNGVTRKELFYFNLKNNELLEMELSSYGGFEERVNRIIREQNQKKLIKLFKEFILAAYGIKSDDGRRHDKSPQITADFVGTNAYSKLFMELAFDADAGAEFINGLVTQEQLAEVKAQFEALKAREAAKTQEALPVEPIGPAATLADVNPVAQELAAENVGGNPGGSRFSQ